MNFRIIDDAHPEWLKGLKQMGPVSPPDRLFLAGRPLDPEVRMVAIVGARTPTSAGLDAAHSISRGIAQAGWGVVSGLAQGIDTAAHRAALDVGGYTIAVLGCGLDWDYPKKNLRLKEQISQRGTLVSEYEIGTSPKAGYFPARNRIIAALAEAVVFVEGGSKSGGLITARWGLDMNRSIFAVPGSHRNRMADGPNELIRCSEAALITDVKHIFEDLAPGLVWEGQYQPGLEQPRLQLRDPELAILCFLDEEPVTVDRICRELALDYGKVALALSRLEVRGMIVSRGGRYSVTSAGARARGPQQEMSP